MFTVASQHVHGDSVEQCIDNAQVAIAATSFPPMESTPAQHLPH